MKLSAPSSNHQRRKILLTALLILSCLVAASAFLLSSHGGSRTIWVSELDGSRVRLDVSALKGMRLLNLKTEREEIITYGTANTLVIFLSPGDCPNCLRERSVWEELNNAHDAAKLRVVGVLVRSSIAEARTFAKAYQFPFPLYFADKNRVGQATPLPQLTPFKVLVNAQGDVLLADGPNANASTQKIFGQKVSESLMFAEVTK